MMLPDHEEIHFWQLQQSNFDLAGLDEFTSWLTEDESARFRRYQFDRHKRQLLLGRVLLRSVLSRCVPAVLPPQWQFVYNRQGKPQIEPGQIEADLFFNLSHSGDRIVLVLGRYPELGIDIEFSQRPRRVTRLVDRFFSGMESRDLLHLSPAQYLQRFYELWTLKEAYIKARGLGLALPLNSFSFSFPATGHIDFTVHESDAAAGEGQWLFRQLDCGADYACAIAANWPAASRTPTLRGWRMTAVNEFREESLTVLAANHN